MNHGDNFHGESFTLLQHSGLCFGLMYVIVYPALWRPEGPGIFGSYRADYFVEVGSGTVFEGVYVFFQFFSRGRKQSSSSNHT